MLYMCGVMVQCIDFSPITQEPGNHSMLGINTACQLTGQKVIEAELTSVDCGATSGHFMNHKRRPAERKEARWSTHSFHTSMNVCMPVVFHCIYMYVFIVFSLYQYVYPIVQR